MNAATMQTGREVAVGPISEAEVESLMAENQRVIWYFRKRLSWAGRAFGETQDVLQELRMYMIQAIHAWHREGRYCKLANYLFRGMKQVYQQVNRCRLIRLRRAGSSEHLNHLKEQAKDVHCLGDNQAKLLARESVDYSWIREYVEELPDRERAVISMRFALDDGESVLLKKIGDQFRISKERARQLVVRGLTMLREIMAEDVVDFFN